MLGMITNFLLYQNAVSKVDLQTSQKSVSVELFKSKSKHKYNENSWQTSRCHTFNGHHNSTVAYGFNE